MKESSIKALNLLNDYNSNYKMRLASLYFPLLMYTYELYRIFVLIQSLQNLGTTFLVMKYVSFSTTPTMPGSHLQLTHQSSSLTNMNQHCFFHRMICLWKTLPLINLSLSFSTIKHELKHFMWGTSLRMLLHTDLVYTSHLVYPCNRCRNHTIPLTSVSKKFAFSHSFWQFLPFPIFGSQ